MLDSITNGSEPLLPPVGHVTCPPGGRRCSTRGGWVMRGNNTRATHFLFTRACAPTKHQHFLPTPRKKYLHSQPPNVSTKISKIFLALPLSQRKLFISQKRCKFVLAAHWLQRPPIRARRASENVKIPAQSDASHKMCFLHISDRKSQILN